MMTSCFLFGSPDAERQRRFYSYINLSKMTWYVWKEGKKALVAGTFFRISLVTSKVNRAKMEHETFAHLLASESN